MKDSEIRLKQLRDPQRSTFSFRTTRYSKKPKMQKIIYIDYKDIYVNQDKIGMESFLEDAFAIIFEQSQDILEYLPQSVPKNREGLFKPLFYVTKDGITVEWTPDFGVIWRIRRPSVFEIKSLDKLKENPSKLKDLFEKWSQSRNNADKDGFDLFVFTDSFIGKSYRVENIAALKSQIRFSDRECELEILKLFEEDKNGKFTTRQIQEIISLSSEFTYNVIMASTFKLVYYEQLFVDFEKEFTIDTPISNDESLRLPLFNWLERYKFNGIEESEKLSLIDENSLSETQQKNFQMRKAIIMDYKSGIHYKTIIKKYGTSKRTIRRLWKRSEKGTNMKNLIRKTGSGRPKFQLFQINSKYEPDFIDEQFGSAMKYFEKKGKATKKDIWEDYKTRVRLEAYDLGLIDNPRVSYRKLRHKIDNFPSKETFYRELDRYIDEFKPKIFRKRFGTKMAQKLMRNVTGTTPYTHHLGQICEADHTTSNIIGIVPPAVYLELIEKKKGFRLKTQYMDRPIITAIIDLKSRVIPGYSFRYRKASRESTFMAIRRTFLGNINPLLSEKEQREMSTAHKILSTIEKMYYTDLIPEETYLLVFNEFDPKDGSTGLREVSDWWDNLRLDIRNFHTDNGADLTSIDVQNFGYKYDMQFFVRPVGGANYGGHIERVLQTLNRKAFHTIPGTTGSSPQHRGDYPSEQRAILSFEQMEAIFLLNLLKYHVTEHSELGMTPMEAWKQAVREGDNLSILRSKEEIKELAYNTIPVESRKYSLNKGISIDNIWYNYETTLPGDKSWIAQFNSREEISVRRDSSDIRFVWWWNPNLESPVRVWAVKLSFGAGRSFGDKRLRRIPPISILQYRDIKAQIKLNMGLELIEMYEELANGVENVIFSIKNQLPESRKSKQKALNQIAKSMEVERIASKETKETASYFRSVDDNFSDELEEFDDNPKNKEDIIVESFENSSKKVDDQKLVENSSKKNLEKVFTQLKNKDRTFVKRDEGVKRR